MSSVGQFWYWKFNIFLSLENQVSRFFSGSYSSTATFFVILMRCSKVNVDRQLRTSDFILFELKVLQPFKESEFLAILGNVLQNLQVIMSFSYTSQEKSESWHESWNCLLKYFSSATATFDFHFTALLAGLVCTISTLSMNDDFDCLLAPVTASSLSPFLFKKFNSFKFWDIFTCLRMHTAH